MKADFPVTVCVTGAAGFIGSWLVMRLLERGYIVRATVRDAANMKKVKHLLELPKADTNLTLWRADLTEEGSFGEAIEGCHGVFHMATPMDFESKDPENEIIKPTIEGVLGIIKSCAKAKTVKRLVFTSSAGTVNGQEHQLPVYNEDNWSDLDFINSKKMTAWMYFVSKTLAEKAAWEAAKENNIDFISIIPTLVVGPFIMPTFPPSLITALSLITGNEPHYGIIKQCQYVHLDDLCESHIFLYENPKAGGRYICSSHDATIHDLAKMIREKWPEYNVPTEFKGIEKDLPVVSFSSKKLVHMGFEFKYTLEDMFKGAIDTCREKGLLPYSTDIAANSHTKSLLPHSTEIEAKAANDHTKGLLPNSIEIEAKSANDIAANSHTKSLLPHSTEIEAKAANDHTKGLLPNSIEIEAKTANDHTKGLLPYSTDIAAKSLLPHSTEIEAKAANDHTKGLLPNSIEIEAKSANDHTKGLLPYSTDIAANSHTKSLLPHSTEIEAKAANDHTKGLLPYSTDIAAKSLLPHSTEIEAKTANDHTKGLLPNSIEIEAKTANDHTKGLLPNSGEIEAKTANFHTNEPVPHSIEIHVNGK